MPLKPRDLIIKELYLKQEMSAADIRKELGFSLKIIYSSLLRQNIARRTSAATNNIRFLKSPLTYDFKKDFSAKERQLLTAALMLYVGEGAKTGHTVDFTNSNAQALKIFMRFLRDICRVQESKLRIYIYCYKQHDVKALIEYWADQLRVPKSAFTKPYVRNRGKNSERICENGVVHIRYNDKRLLEKILFLCEKVMVGLIS